MASIRIIKVPAGEAPESIREAWVGVELTLPPDQPTKPLSHLSQGVLSGAKTPLGMLIRALWRRERTAGYSVEVLDSVAVLERSNPEAARWWRENVPHMMHRGRRFVFRVDECEEVQNW